MEKFSTKIFKTVFLISCWLNHVLWVKSIAANENQLQLFIQQFFYTLQLIFPIHLLFDIHFTQSTWFTTSKLNCQIFLIIYWKIFKFTSSLQNTFVICAWSGPKYKYILLPKNFKKPLLLWSVNFHNVCIRVFNCVPIKI